MVLRELVNLIGFEIDHESMREAENNLGRVQEKLSSFGQKASMYVTAPLMAVAGFMVEWASDATEVQNKFDQVFDEVSDRANTFANEFSTKLGRSIMQVQEGMSAFQSMFLGLGFENSEALEYTQKLQEMMTDFGSFHNVSDKESMERFVSAMSGSSEVLDRFGVNLRQASLEQKLFDMGIDKSVSQASEAEKALARLMIIEETLGRQGALGDAVRTMDEFANRKKRFFSTVKNMAIGFGKIILPSVNKALGALIAFINKIDSMSSELKEYTWVIAGLAMAIGPISLALALLIKTVFFVQKAFVGLTLAIRGTNMAFTTLSVKILAWVAILLVAIAVVGLLWEDIRTWMNGGDSLIGKFLGSWDDFAEYWAARIEPIITYAKNIFESAKNLIHGIVELLIALLTDDIERGAKAFETIFEAMFQGLKNWLPMLGYLILMIGEMVFKAASTGFKMMLKAAGNLFSSIATLLWSFLSGAWDWVLDFIDRVVDKIKDIPNMIKDKALGALGKAGDFFKYIATGEDNTEDGSFEKFEKDQYAKNMANSFTDGKSEKSFNVDSTVNLQIPSGTPDEQATFLKETARNEFRDEFNSQLRSLMVASAGGE